MPIVVNSANGQGAGQQDKNTAEWTPAHVVGSPLLFHPTVFDLAFTFHAYRRLASSELLSAGRAPDRQEADDLLDWRITERSRR